MNAGLKRHLPYRAVGTMVALMGVGLLAKRAWA